MPLPRFAIPSVVALAGCFVSSGPACGQDGKAKSETWEQDTFEEKMVHRSVERAVKAADTEGGRWLAVLAKAFPGKIGAGLTEADVTKWYDLLAGDGREWRRDAAPTRQVAELFDRAANRLELGPVPSIRREEYMNYARRQLVSSNPEPQKPAERSGDADRVFRVLDRDGSGALEAGEWPEQLRAAARRADADGNRRVDADEYRAYYDGRVTDALDAKAKATAAPKASEPAAKTGGLPAWFTDMDTDGDGQIGLYEWRTGGRLLTEFMGMDLNGDGLLPPDEYQRYARATEAATGSTVTTPVAADMAKDDRQAGMKKRVP